VYSVEQGMYLCWLKAEQIQNVQDFHFLQLKGFCFNSLEQIQASPDS
jgi:hypothetical protein